MARLRSDREHNRTEYEYDGALKGITIRKWRLPSITINQKGKFKKHETCAIKEIPTFWELETAQDLVFPFTRLVAIEYRFEFDHQLRVYTVQTSLRA